MEPEKVFLWENRDEDLSKVIRYHGEGHRFEVMMYRTDLRIHTTRTEAMMERVIPVAKDLYPDFDPMLARLISRHHDDPEMPWQDVPLYLKLNMNDRQKQEHHKEESDAIDMICEHYPKEVEGYSYRKILLHSLNKDCREAQLHSLIDKFDGYCEALHEAFAGNAVFMEPVINYNTETFAKRYGKFHLIHAMFDHGMRHKHPFLSFPTVNFMELFSAGRRRPAPHTLLTLSLNSGIPAYEEWKRITMETFANGEDLLTKQKEFH